jgi:tetratricopeptide (TPR) repeat protein
MTSYLKILCCLFILAGCGATVPQQTETKVNRPDSVFPTRPEPADVAVLPFKNQTGDPELDFPGTTISATMAVGLAQQKAWSVAGGSLVREKLADQKWRSAATIEEETAISLSGVLRVETPITGVFQGKERDLTVTATYISGETGKVTRSVTEKARKIKSDADIAFSLGYVHEQMGQYAESIKAFSLAIEMKPDDYDAYYGLASAYEKSGRLQEALSSFQQVVKLKPDEEVAIRTLGAIAHKMARWDEVIDAFEWLIVQNPDEVGSHRILASAYKAKGQDQKLIGAYTEIIRLDPSSSVAYTNLGNFYVRLKDYNKGVSQYRAGIKATPEFELLHYNLGSRFSE